MGEFLITESTGYLIPNLNESTTSGRLKFRGKFQEANAINKNKRMYPFEVLAENVKRLNESIKNRSLLGELDHPDNSIVHFDKASHVVTKLWWENNTLMGEGEVLETPHGEILRNLLDAGVRVGISSRGVGNGTTNNEGVLVIGESYKLITFDVVADPSTFEAFQKVVSTNKTESYINNSMKNDDTSVNNNINTNALIAYIGQLLEQKKQEIRKNILNEGK